MDYGQCQFCGANNVKSPRTGKIFCSEKCWLKNQLRPQGQYQPRQQYQPKPQPKPEPDWDKIRDDKEAGMEWLNAKNNATAIIVALIEKNGMPLLEAKGLFRELTQFIYETGEEQNATQDQEQPNNDREIGL